MKCPEVNKKNEDGSVTGHDNSVQPEGDSDSELDIPLAKLRTINRNPRKRKLFQESGTNSKTGYDDDVNDPTFIV